MLAKRVHREYVVCLGKGDLLPPLDYLETTYPKDHPHTTRVNELLILGKFASLEHSFALAEKRFGTMMRY